MPNYLPFILTLVLFTVSCKKKVEEGNQTKLANPFGVLVNDPSPGTNVSFNTNIAHQLGVPYMRDAISLNIWNGISDAAYNSEIASGFKVVLNVNNSLVITGIPVPYPTDLPVYKAKLTSLLSVVQPEMVVIENEETNRLYHTGPYTDYVAELQAAIDVAHAKNLKITNGGITAQIVFLVYRDYYNRGLYAEAADYASRTMSSAIIADLPGLTHHTALAQRVDSTQYLVDQYKTMNLDYVNLHWYEPISDNYIAIAPYYGTKAFKETVEYLKRATGKTVITNEVGQDNTTPAIATDLMQAIIDIKLPYAIWYDGDGTSAFGLHEKGTTTLRPNGQAFAAFIKSHFWVLVH